VENSCASKSWNTMPIVPASSPTRRPWMGSPRRRTSPVTSAGTKQGTRRVRHRASVDLPAPLAPMTTASAPGGSSRSRAASAGRHERHAEGHAPVRQRRSRSEQVAVEEPGAPDARVEDGEQEGRQDERDPQVDHENERPEHREGMEAERLEPPADDRGAEGG